MPTIESQARMINRHIQQIYETFGLESVEYMQAKKAIELATINAPELVTTNKSGVLMLKRGKTLEQHHGAKIITDTIRDAQKQQGTAKQIAKKYLEEQKAMLQNAINASPDFIGAPKIPSIKKLAQEKYFIQNNSMEYYDDSAETIQDDAYLQLIWEMAGKASKGKVKDEENPLFTSAFRATEARKNGDFVTLKAILESVGINTNDFNSYYRELRDNITDDADQLIKDGHGAEIDI